jgi:hypothetical protein
MSTTATKERPILFSGEMVRAILDGRKTQTRRIVKPQPPSDINVLYGGEFTQRAPHVIECDETGLPIGFGFQYDDDRLWKCPYGQPGERLWVREAFAPRSDVELTDAEKARHYCLYKASGGDPRDEMNWHDYGSKWRPSIHMPRVLSRIDLEITGVRVERVREISADDCLAEGITPQGIGSDSALIAAYEKLWCKINGTASWDANPFVWVVEFRRLA